MTEQHPAGSWLWALDWLERAARGTQDRGLSCISPRLALDSAIDLRNVSSVIDRVHRLFFVCIELDLRRIRALMYRGERFDPNTECEVAFFLVGLSMLDYVVDNPAPVPSCDLDAAVLLSGDRVVINAYCNPLPSWLVEGRRKAIANAGVI